MRKMCFDIRVGRYRLRMVDAVKVKHSVEQLSDTAEIVLPAMVEGSALMVEEKLNVGDAVSIMLGYDDSLQTEFKGYLKAIRTDGGNLTLECEDALYLWDKKVNDEELNGVSLHALLTKVAAQIDPAYTVECDFDFSYDKFTIYYCTGRDVLKKVQEETKANIYFSGNTLYVKPQYAEASARRVVFDFSRNIESADLKYRRASDKDVEVEVVLSLPNGKSIEHKAGKQGGKSIKKIVSGVPESELKKLADNEYNAWCYDGYEGSFTGWLVPYVEPGDSVKLHDADYEYKDGTYYVTGTEVSFSKDGGKRTVSLGRRIG